jgi:hypothetical protein
MNGTATKSLQFFEKEIEQLQTKVIGLICQTNLQPSSSASGITAMS